MRLRRRLAHDAPHLGDEAHVEHAVGFVDHQHLDAVEVDLALAVEIHQASGRGDQDVDQLALELLALAVVVDAADQRHDVQPGMGRQFLGILADLQHQFARGRDHQRARLADVARLIRRIAQQVGS